MGSDAAAPFDGTMIMDLSSAVLEKIRSTDLRNEAVSEAEQPHTVIVELDLPMPKLESIGPKPIGFGSRPRLRFAPSEPASDLGSRIEASKEDIATITGRRPEAFLSTSGSFVVNATGEQIGRIAKMPSVSAIWPNTRRGG